MKTVIASVFASLIWVFAVYPQRDGQATDEILKALERELTAAALFRGKPCRVISI